MFQYLRMAKRQGERYIRHSRFCRVEDGRIRLPTGKERVDQHTHFIHEPVTLEYTVERSPLSTRTTFTPNRLFSASSAGTHIDMVIPGNDDADPPIGKVVEVFLRC